MQVNQNAENESEEEWVRLVKMMNPYRFDGFTGAWSNVSDLWTEDHRNQAMHSQLDDGEFFITVEDVQKNFRSFTLTKDVGNW